MPTNPNINFALVNEMPNAVERGTVYMSAAKGFIKVAKGNNIIDVIYDASTMREYVINSIADLYTRLQENEEQVITQALVDINDRLEQTNTDFDEKLNQLDTSINNRITLVDTSINNRITLVDTSLNNKIDTLDTSINTRVDQLDTSVNGRIDQIESSDNDNELTIATALTDLNKRVSILETVEFLPDED